MVLFCLFFFLYKTAVLPNRIKVLTALVGRLSLSVGRENGPEWGLKTVAINLNFLLFKQTLHSVASVLGPHCLPMSHMTQMSQSKFYR